MALALSGVIRSSELVEFNGLTGEAMAKRVKVLKG